MALKDQAARLFRSLTETRLINGPERSAAARLLCAAAIVGAVTFAVFLPAVNNGFVSWDDQKNFLETTGYRGLGPQQMKWIWGDTGAGFYIPVTRLAMAVDYRLWGLTPGGHHFSGVLLHACNATLLFLLNVALFRRFKAAGDRALLPAAAFAALFFALHPLRAEPAAWASGLHDPLSTLFYLLTVLSYIRLRSGAGSRLKWTLASGLFFALALLAKPAGLLLPLVLMLLDLHLFPAEGLKEKLRGAVRGKLHLLLLILPVAAVTLRSHQDVGSVYSFANYTALQRVTQAMYGGIFYLWKTLLPLGLSPLYQLDIQLQPWLWPYWLTTALFLGMTCIFIFLARRGSLAGLTVWAAYLLLLAPVSGLAQTGYQAAADRYSYLTFLPWTLLLTGGALSVKKYRGPLLLAALALLAALSLSTRRQLGVWHDSETLWRQAIAVERDSTYALDNLGDALADSGKVREAVPFYERAVIINPSFYEAHNDLATAYFETGRLEKAIKHFSLAVKIKPDYVLGHHNLANICYFVTNQPEAAVFHYRKVTELEPKNPVYQAELGRALFRVRKFDAALRRFRIALELDPKNKLASAGKRETARLLGQ